MQAMRYHRLASQYYERYRLRLSAHVTRASTRGLIAVTVSTGVPGDGRCTTVSRSTRPCA